MDNDGLQQQPKNNADHLRPYQWKKGQSGNPNGRPKGSSVKERAKAMLAAMTEAEFEDFLHGLDKKTIWEMAEGKPEASIDHTTDGQPITFVVSGPLAEKNGITPETDRGSEGQDTV